MNSKNQQTFSFWARFWWVSALLVLGTSMCIFSFFWRASQPLLLQGEEVPVVHIFNWAKYIPDSVIEEFTRTTGIRVVYGVFDSTEMLEATLLAARSGYDVVFVPAWPYLPKHIAAGLYQPLQWSLLPSPLQLDPKLMEYLSSADPEHQYAVPYLWGTTGLGYDEEILRLYAPEAPRDSWALVFDPNVAKKLAKGGISLLDSPMDVFPAALIYLGYDPNTQDPEALERAVRLIQDVMPFVRKFDSAQFMARLMNRELCIAQGYSTFLNMARMNDPQAKQEGRSTLRYIIPKEGAMVWMDVMVVLKDAPHPRNAHKFISFIMQPHIMARITMSVCAANALPESAKFIPPSFFQDSSIYPPVEMFSRLYNDKPMTEQQQRARSRAWIKAKTGY